MDVVKTSVEKIGGVLELQSELGVGTTIKIRIPLTLAIVPGVIVAGGRERFILPQRNLIELLRVEPGFRSGPVEVIHETPVLHWRGSILPLIDLRDLLCVAGVDRAETIYIAVLQGEERFFGLVLDEVEDVQEIVVKPLDPQLKCIPTYAGAAVLGDGEVCLILDINGILKHVGLEGGAPASTQQTASKEMADANELTLLCRVGDSAQVAISLSYLDRLEEVPRRALEYASGHLVMQYRGGVLPLVKLNEVLGLEERYDDDSDNFALLVFRRGDRSVGFVVRKVLDIVTEATMSGAERQSALSRPAVIGGNTVDVLNCRRLLEQYDPEWFANEMELAISSEKELEYA